MPRLFLALGLCLTLLACADGRRELTGPVEPLGDFRLGFSEVVAPNIQKGPLSREGDPAKITAAVDTAIEQRFGRYDGDRIVHLGVSVEAYVLAQPGIPLVLAPKSALIVRVTAFNDATQSKFNEESELLTVLESLSTDTVLGSGLTQTPDEQLDTLAANIALAIETWLREKDAEEGWFSGAASPKGAVPARAAPPADGAASGA